MLTRGEVYLLQSDRPVILVSRDAMTASSPVAVVAPVVNHADWPNVSPGDVVLRAGSGGLPTESVVLTGHVRAIEKTRLVNRLGQLAPESMAAVEAALRITLDL